MLQEENVARKISQLLQLFLPQQYNFSQFASFFSCNLYSKGSNRCPPAYYFLDFFRTTPARLPHMLLILTIATPCLLIFLNLFESKKFFSFTMTDIHATYYQILLIFLTLIVVWGKFLYGEVRQTQF